MSRSGNQRTLDKRISIKKALRGKEPNESSATRDSMNAVKRGWGSGKNIDEGVQMWDKAGIHEDQVSAEDMEEIYQKLEEDGYL